MKNCTFNQDLWDGIESLDFEILKNQIKIKKGWSDELVNWVESRYKEFLYLTVARKEETIVPSDLVDELWHAHILDTRKYAEDCEKVFGGFLHHFPYLGLRGDDDLKHLKTSFKNTEELLQQTFASTYQLPNTVAAKCHGNCSGAVATTLKDVGVDPVAAKCHGNCSGAVATTLKDVGVDPVTAMCHEAALSLLQRH